MNDDRLLFALKRLGDTELSAASDRKVRTRLETAWTVRALTMATRTFSLRHLVPVAGDVIHSDDLPGFRRPAGPRKIGPQALVCRWSLIDGGTRLGCRWHPETLAQTALEDPDFERASNHACRRKQADLNSLNPDP